MIGRERPLAMLEDAIHIDERAHVVFVEHFDLVDLMRGAEAVEEMQERDARLERSGVCDERHVHGLLHGIGGKHGEAGSAAGHHIRMVAEDRERVSRQRARRNMKRRGRKLSRNLVHVRNHEQQALGRGERSRQRASLQRAVNSPGSTAFALHLHYVGHRSPDVLDSLRRPLVRPFAHVGRRGDGIDGNHFVNPVGDVCDRLVCIHGLELALHSHRPPLMQIRCR